ncbi:hypothetical protein TNCV_2680591 [Trichonephila clavipes]|uniref:Uncharacterized protein n=1 Tax=Trichonephila clavipes TaxID=2585209 RepID=A0A8X6SBH9_TRICX|nr:hypothetical protein TNCV_2680591 [Trichonephila clavipes]
MTMQDPVSEKKKHCEIGEFAITEPNGVVESINKDVFKGHSANKEKLSIIVMHRKERCPILESKVSGTTFEKFAWGCV